MSIFPAVIKLYICRSFGHDNPYVFCQVCELNCFFFLPKLALVNYNHILLSSVH